jgi:hypothetical protein
VFAFSTLRNIVFLIAEHNFTVLHHTCVPHKLNYMHTAFAGAALGMENWLCITFATGKTEAGTQKTEVLLPEASITNQLFKWVSAA